MEIKILQVFYDKNGLPYKDKERTVHYPITSGTFLGASNTTQIRFYYDKLDELNESTFVAVSKLPNGKIGSEILESEYDSELQENYAVLNLSQFYTQYKGDVFISLQGYQGGVRVEQDENGIYQIYGTPTIQATGSIRMYVAYAPTFVGSGQTENITLQRVLAELATKLGIRQETLHVEELPTSGNPNVWYVINDDPNDPTKANIYIWNATTQTYVWVGDNTLDLGNYYTQEQGEQFEEGIDNRITNVENELSSVASGSPAGVYATASDLLNAFPNGDNHIYLVLADGKWYYWDTTTTEWTAGGTYLSSLPDNYLSETSANSIQNKVVTTQLLKRTFNPTTIWHCGYWDNNSFHESGVGVAIYSDEIILGIDCQINFGIDVSFGSFIRIAEYNMDGTFVRIKDYSTKETPIWFNFEKDKKYILSRMNNSITVSTSDVTTLSAQFTLSATNGLSLPYLNVKYETKEIVETIEWNCGYWDSGTNKFTLSSPGNSIFSSMIKVDKNTEIYFKREGSYPTFIQVAVYDMDGVYKENESFSLGYDFFDTTFYFSEDRLVVLARVNNSVAVTNEDVASISSQFEYSFNKMYSFPYLLNKIYQIGKNKKVAVIGDSLMENANEGFDGWGTVLKDKLGVNIIGVSIGGTKIRHGDTVSYPDGFQNGDSFGSIDLGNSPGSSPASFCDWYRINLTIPEDSDVIILGTGVNELNSNPIANEGDMDFVENDTTDSDWALSTKYSTYGGDYKINTIKGALCSTIMKLQAKAPNAKIFMCNWCNSRGTNGQIGYATADKYYNDNLLKYIKDVCEQFGVELIDLFANSGINPLNRTKYTVDTIHLNKLGYKTRMVTPILTHLENYFNSLEEK